MQVLAVIVKTIDTINDWIGKIVAFLLIPAIFITAYEVIMRYFFTAPTIWAWELNLQFWAAIVLLSGGYVLLKNGHVRVDVVYNMFDIRKRAVLDIMAYLLIMICMVLVIKYGLNLGIASFLKGERQATVWASPMWTIRMLIPVGCILLFLQGISETIKSLYIIRGINILTGAKISAEEVK